MTTNQRLDYMKDLLKRAKATIDNEAKQAILKEYYQNKKILEGFEDL